MFPIVLDGLNFERRNDGMRAAATIILRYVLLAGLLLLCAAGTSKAALGEGGQRRVALVVGNTTYRFVTPLKNAVRDSRDIAATLRSLGFEVIETSDASLQQFRSSLDEFYRASADADAAVFYYSGHGFQLNGINYLVPVDATLKDRALVTTETIGLDEIAKKSQGRNRQTLIFLDACRNNPLPPALRTAGGSEGLAQLETGSGTFIAFATQPGNITRDGAGDHSPFASALLKHMPAPGISISDMMIRVRNSVEVATLHTQTPWDQSSLRSQFYFNPEPEADGGLTVEDREMLLSLDPEMRRKFEARFGLNLGAAGKQAADDEALVPGIVIESADEPILDADADAIAGGAVAQPAAVEGPLNPTIVISPGTSDTAAVFDGTPADTDEALLPSDNAVLTAHRTASQSSGAVPSVGELAAAVVGATAAVGNVSSYDTIAGIAAAARTLRVASQALPLGGAPESGVAERPQGASEVRLPTQSDAAILGGGENGARRPAGRAGEYDVAVLSSEERSVAIPSVTSDSLSPVPSDARRIVGEEVVTAPDIVPDAVVPPPADVRVAALDPLEAAGLAARDDVPQPDRDEGGADLPEDLPRAVQQELLRLGCYRSTVDGEWGSGSARALLRYYATKRIEPDVLEPGAELYARLSDEDAVVCTRTETRPDVKQPARTKPAGARPPKAEPRQEAARPPRSKPKSQAARPPKAEPKQEAARPPRSKPKSQTARPPRAEPKQEAARPPRKNSKQQAARPPKAPPARATARPAPPKQPSPAVASVKPPKAKSAGGLKKLTTIGAFR